MNLILKIQKLKSPQISESDGCSDTRIVIKTEGFGTKHRLFFTTALTNRGLQENI